jgi:hypothetical protein
MLEDAPLRPLAARETAVVAARRLSQDAEIGRPATVQAVLQEIISRP